MERLDLSQVYRAELRPHHPQPVRFIEVNRMWSLVPRYGGIVVASRVHRRTSDGLPPTAPTGLIALTGSGDTSLPRAYPSTRLGAMSLAATLYGYTLPHLPKAPRHAAAVLSSMIPHLTEEGLGLALVHPVRNLQGEWEEFPASVLVGQR